uniref:Uncharacterized protein n=1 Tax=Alexandrium catenella TaxID=2925 RepID=A0A7S1Q3C0_ALECA
MQQPSRPPAPRRRDLLLLSAAPAALLPAGPATAEEKLLGGQEDGGYRVVRPSGPDEPRFFNFLLPTEDPLLEGKRFGDRSNPDKKEKGAMFLGQFGGKADPKSMVLAGELPKDFLKNIRGNTYPEGTGIISDTASEKFADLEWTDKDKQNGKEFTVHNFARVFYRGKTKDAKTKNAKTKDVLLLLQLPETQVERLRPLWPEMRDTMVLEGEE